MKFGELQLKVLGEDTRRALPAKILSLDPGETTGFAIWKKQDWLLDEGGNPTVKEPLHCISFCGQLNTKTIREGFKSFGGLISTYRPDLIVIEDYRVYGWKTEEHAWSNVHTIQLIGMIKGFCVQTPGTPFVLQSAQVAKQFCTDDKLEQWDYWKVGMRHGRDAIRHGAYYILFGSQKNYDSEGYVQK